MCRTDHAAKILTKLHGRLDVRRLGGAKPTKPSSVHLLASPTVDGSVSRDSKQPWTEAIRLRLRAFVRGECRSEDVSRQILGVSGISDLRDAEAVDGVGVGLIDLVERGQTRARRVDGVDTSAEVATARLIMN